YAHFAPDDPERRFCLERAAAINPDSTAKSALERLDAVESRVPDALQDLTDPDPPDALLAADSGPRRPPVGWIIVGAIALLALLGGLIAWQLGSRKSEGSPLYVALATSMVGNDAVFATEMERSIQLELDRLNADGGIDGHPVQLLTFDDGNTPEQAVAVAGQIAADDRILAVIGHRTSGPSLAAGAVYAENAIPAITSTANANAVTDTNPWYFRTTFDNTRQGTLIAAGIEHLLGLDQLILIQGTDVYGQDLGRTIASAFSGEIVALYDLPDESAIPAIIEELRRLGSDAPIVLSLQGAVGTPLIVALKDAGITNQLIGGDVYGSDAYLRTFADYPGEQSNPGHYTDGMIAAAPLFMDSLSAEALRWSQRFEEAYGVQPTWRGATTADAALALIAALEQVGFDPGRSNDDTRVELRNALAGFNDPERSTAGVLGRIWFDETRTAPRNIAAGIASDQLYSSAPVQFVPYRPSGNRTIAEDIESGDAIPVEGLYLQKQRIVFTGLNMNEVSALDLGSQTFNADFFLWLRYSGSDDAADIQFINAVDPSLSLGDPIREAKSGGETYQLFRVNGAFKAQMDFHDFPFDTQNLLIQVQNRSLPASRIVYTLDRGVREQSQEQRLQSGVDADATVSNIPNWLPVELSFYQQSIGSTAALGDPTVGVSDQGIEYSVLTTDLGIERDVEAFLIKNLLPLTLLVIVTYVSLFFSHSQTGARVSFGVTGILTTAVLLTEVTSSLPDIGYNVAIEWAFYAFIGLCAGCILVGLIGDFFFERQQFGHLRQLDIVARILYPAIVAGVVLTYWVQFGR
ncbi:MAG: ABC transporter substrate-binding protein, partial [Chloroflexota bacterium]